MNWTLIIKSAELLLYLLTGSHNHFDLKDILGQSKSIVSCHENEGRSID